jgi:hypothetical protein
MQTGEKIRGRRSTGESKKVMGGALLGSASSQQIPDHIEFCNCAIVASFISQTFKTIGGDS